MSGKRRAIFGQRERRFKASAASSGRPEGEASSVSFPIRDGQQTFTPDPRLVGMRSNEQNVTRIGPNRFEPVLLAQPASLKTGTAWWAVARYQPSR
jgi:hypothetical protein